MKRQSLLAVVAACALASAAHAQNSSYSLRNGATSVTGSTVNDSALAAPATPTPDMVADRQLLAQLVSALATDPALAGAQVDVRVENGRVTLSGVARDLAQQQQARTIASTIAGAANVTDRMTTGG